LLTWGTDQKKHIEQLPSLRSCPRVHALSPLLSKAVVQGLFVSGNGMGDTSSVTIGFFARRTFLGLGLYRAFSVFFTLRFFFVPIGVCSSFFSQDQTIPMVGLSSP